MKGKRGPTPGPVKPKGGAAKKGAIKTSRKRAREKDSAGGGNLDLIPIDQRQILEIEQAEEMRQAASGRLSEAHEDLEAAEKAVVAAMHEAGFDVTRRPVYTRVPWGSVTLTVSGEVKEKIKFTRQTPKKKAKPGEGEPDED